MKANQMCLSDRFEGQFQNKRKTSTRQFETFFEAVLKLPFKNRFSFFYQIALSNEIIFLLVYCDDCASCSHTND
jgi:hypothetical protein